MSLANLRRALRAQANPQKAQNSARFFKTKPGQYGAGDRFLGITVPEQRLVARRYWQTTSITETEKLLRSPYHEDRLTALFILVKKFAQGTVNEQKKIYATYLRNTAFVNNWDLVDSSAEYIVGAYCAQHGTAIITKLSQSKNLWERRIAMLACFHFIKKSDFGLAITVATQLLHDPEDLMHKAVGWMLREIGNRSLPTEEKFLNTHAAVMPRTMLRYAIEKFPPAKRQRYMAMKKESGVV